MNLQTPIIRATIPKETRSQLSKTPWCKTILSNPQKYIPIKSTSREPKPNSTEDSLIANTFATTSTFPIWQSFYKIPNDDSPNSDDNATQREGEAGNGEILVIISSGSGVNGHSNTLHGGAISVLLDEILGLAVTPYSKPGIPIYTAFLNTTFKKPIQTPGVMLGRAWMVPEKSGGRKYWTKGCIEDGCGTVYATGEALLVEVREARL